MAWNLTGQIALHIGVVVVVGLHGFMSPKEVADSRQHIQIVGNYLCSSSQPPICGQLRDQ